MSTSGSSSNRYRHLMNDLDRLQGYLFDPESEIKDGDRRKLTRLINECRKVYEPLDHHHYDSTDRNHDDDSLANKKTCEMMDDVLNLISMSHPDESAPKPRDEPINERLTQAYSCFFLMEEGAVIKKKELIYWWVGQGLIEDGEKDAEAAAGDILKKLVDLGIIEQLFCSKRGKKSCKYRAIKGMINQEQQIKDAQQNIRMLKIQESSNSIELVHPDGKNIDEKSTTEKRVERLYNRDVSIIDVPHERLRRMKNDLKVLQLGRWSGDEAEQKHMELVNVNDLLKYLKQLKKVRLISFRGVSRIMELGEEICRLGDNLRVLDLQACANLEVLPKGIGTLKNLTHLDLSECYLLDRIPKGITCLTKLQVLEGFVVGDVITASSCTFKDLATHLGTTLKKLSIRTRKESFPGEDDLKAFAKFDKLSRLKLVWVRISDADDEVGVGPSRSLVGLPEGLQKLEVQAIPQTAVKSLMWDSRHRCHQLEKLNIIGGQISDLTDQGRIKWKTVERMQLKHLTHLHMNWRELKASFPKLNYLFKIRCPNLVFFPCDHLGIWKQN